MAGPKNVLEGSEEKKIHVDFFSLMYGKKSLHVNFVYTSVYKELSVLQKAGENAYLIKTCKKRKKREISKSREGVGPIGGVRSPRIKKNPRTLLFPIPK